MAYMMVNGIVVSITSTVTAMTDNPTRNDQPSRRPQGAGKKLCRRRRSARSTRPQARREEYRKREAALPKELGGRGGNEPGPLRRLGR